MLPILSWLFTGSFLAVAGSRVISGYDEETEIAQVTDSF
jgi:hypothetical protein